jgi:hypothetical protein
MLLSIPVSNKLKNWTMQIRLVIPYRIRNQKLPQKFPARHGQDSNPYVL